MSGQSTVRVLPTLATHCASERHEPHTRPTRDVVWRPQTLTTLGYPAPGCARASLERVVWSQHQRLRLCAGGVVQCETLGAVVRDPNASDSAVGLPAVLVLKFDGCLELLPQSALKLNFACSPKHPDSGCCARLRQPGRFYAARSEIFPIGDREPTGSSNERCQPIHSETVSYTHLTLPTILLV